MTFWVAGAVVTGAAISANAAGKASKAQVAASDQAIAEQARQFDITREDQRALLDQQRKDYQPWMDAGRNALTKLVSGFDITQDPSYKFRLAEGEKAIQRSAAARGGLLSGAAAKALSKYGQDAASQEYGNQYNRLASLAGFGQTATNANAAAGQSAYGTIANAGMNAANNISQNIMGAGNARASGYVGGANALQGAVGQGLNFYQGNQLLNRIYPQTYGVPQQPGVTGWVSQG